MTSRKPGAGLPGAPLFGALLCLLAWSGSRVEAQEPPDSVRAELARLRATVDSLAREMARMRTEEAPAAPQPGNELARLRAAAQAAAAGGATPEPDAEPAQQEFVGRQRSLQALNPEISVNADLLGHVDQDDPQSENFAAREFELSIQSSLDPFSRAKVFISRHAPIGEIAPFGAEEEEEHGSGFAVEEGYAEWVSLPGGFNLKLGKFYQQFGQLNRWHAHALPFQSRSLPHLAFVGEEPLGQSGASLHWLVPLHGLGTYEATVEVTRTENEVLFGESARASVLGHLNGFWDLSSSMDLDLGVSWINGSYEDDVRFLDRNLLGAEAALTWRPPGAARYRGLTLRGGVMVLDGLLPDTAAGAPPPAERAMGYWTSGELRLSQSWLVGARFDRVENPEDPDQTAWLASPTLTWWQSEWVRLRAEYDLLGRSFQTAREGRFLIQLTFAMGPHKHETY